MDKQQPGPRIPKIQFRVLIIGRGNAGKTTILQKICGTTDGPIIYRENVWRQEEGILDPSMDRGEHNIDDELVFPNHTGYVFHDSRGIESGNREELGILQEFIRRKCGERRLEGRLHAIWFCVPMDNQRPQLDLRFFKGICPDQNVPVIAVFTRYDQFRRNVEIDVEDYGNPDDNVSDVAEKLFREHYLRPLGDDVRFVRLERMHHLHMRCDELIETTAAALDEDVVGSMLLAVQRDNLGLCVKTALNRVHTRTGTEVKHTVRECLTSFPYIWLYEVSEGSMDLSRPEEPLSLLDRMFQDRFVLQVMSLPSIQNITANGPGGYHLILAVILILKHATFLRLSNMSPESALTRAELDYQGANIDFKIQQLLAASSQEHSVGIFAGFIMATDIVPSQSPIKNTHRKDH